MALWQKTVAPFSEHKGGVGSFLKIPRSNSEYYRVELTSLHSWPKLHRVLAILSAVGLKMIADWIHGKSLIYDYLQTEWEW